MGQAVGTSQSGRDTYAASGSESLLSLRCIVVIRQDSCPGCAPNVIDLSERGSELVCGAVSVFNDRIDEVLIKLGGLTPLGTTDDHTLAETVAKGLWAGFYLAHRHPEWFAELILEGNAIIDADTNADLDWDERREWESVVDRLVSGEEVL